MFLYPTATVELASGPWRKAPNLPVAVLLGRDLYDVSTEMEGQTPSPGLMVVTRSQSSRAEKEREEAVAALPHPLDDEINVDDGGEEQVGESGTTRAFSAALYFRAAEKAGKTGDKAIEYAALGDSVCVKMNHYTLLLPSESPHSLSQFHESGDSVCMYRSMLAHLLELNNIFFLCISCTSHELL